jgi:tetratricopeptide (TPR) repeat protein
VTFINHAGAEDQDFKSCLDQELCQVMLRAGKEAFERGKYSQALSYFKKAIQADTRSDKAWHWYNIALSYALAEQSRQISYPDLKMPESKGDSGGKATEQVPLEENQVPDDMENEEDMEGC